MPTELEARLQNLRQQAEDCRRRRASLEAKIDQARSVKEKAAARLKELGTTPEDARELLARTEAEANDVLLAIEQKIKEATR